MTEPTAAETRRQESKRRYYERNRSKVIERARQYQLNNRGKIRDRKRAAYLQNREQILEERHLYHAQNRDKILERQRAYRERNRERIREAAWRKRHSGLSPHDWAVTWEMQRGLCYLCGDMLTETDAYVDHDHSCCPPKTSCNICRRGLAHSFCNIAIGYAGDDPARLRRMADALEAAKLKVAQRLAAAGSQLSIFE